MRSLITLFLLFFCCLPAYADIYIPSQGASAAASYVTLNNEASRLPNSSQLLAGTNITFTPGTNTITVNSNLSAIGNNTVLGNVSGITAAPVALTATQLTTIPNVFTSSLQGMVPASGGGTINFLRADGTFAAPASGGSPATPLGSLQYNNAGSFGGAAAAIYTTSGNLLTFTAQATSDVPLTIQGAAGQTANLLTVNNSVPSTVAYINKNGDISANTLYQIGGANFAFPHGVQNTFLGFGAGNTTETSTYGSNTFAGYGSGANLTTGYQNTMYGSQCGLNLTSATDNTFIGVQAGRTCTSGIQNTVVGSGAFGNSSSATANTIVGYGAGNSLTTGNSNVLIGGGAGGSINSGGYNSMVGTSVFNAVTTGSYCAGIGYAIFSNDIAPGMVGIGAYIGNESSNTGSNYPVGIGYATFGDSTNYTYSIGIGYQASRYHSGNRDIVLGYLAGYSNGSTNETGGDDCVIIGTSADASTNVVKATALGYNAVAAQSNTTILGGSGTTNFTDVGIGGNTPGAKIDIICESATKKGLKITGFTSQSADLLELLNVTPTVLTSFGSTGLVNKYNTIATAGLGVPAIYGNGRATAQTAANASVATYTVGASDGSFIVCANVNVTASVTHSFTTTVAYTDETNTSRTLTLTFSNVGGTLLTTITNVLGTGAYEGVPLHIRCKAGTSITIATTGTFTSVTYNVEGYITQLG